jgi:cytochrome c oxidase subunit 4
MDTSHLDHPHPNERIYVKVALWLALITAAEIAVSYMDLADWITILTLLVLSLIKFVAVVGYFMHLKFDNPTLRKPFVGGLILALIVYAVVLFMFTLHSNTVG